MNRSYFNIVPEGYETLPYDLHDRCRDAVSQRAKDIEAVWHMQPIIHAWASYPPQDFPNYVARSKGPAAADQLLARGGQAWPPLEPGG